MLFNFRDEPLNINWLNIVVGYRTWKYIYLALSRLKIIWHRSRKVVSVDSSRLLLIMSGTYQVLEGKRYQVYSKREVTDFIIYTYIYIDTIEISLGQGISLMYSKSIYMNERRIPENMNACLHFQLLEILVEFSFIANYKITNFSSHSLQVL